MLTLAKGTVTLVCGCKASTVAPYDRPVQADAIGRCAEMSLRYPAEDGRSVGTTADEGVGTGYDNAFPFAYVEHWFDTSDEPAEVENWYRQQLGLLGWNEEQPSPKRAPNPETRHVVWSRSDDETISLTWFGKEAQLGRAHRSHRLSYTVDGTWPDGSTDSRST